MSLAIIRSMMLWMPINAQLSLIPTMFISKPDFSCFAMDKPTACLGNQVLLFLKTSILRHIKHLALSVPQHRSGVLQLLKLHPRDLTALPQMDGEEAGWLILTRHLNQATLMTSVILLVALFHLRLVLQAQGRSSN